ncbi:hypothetical protein BC940DRAFT_73756 [Gongronella butleri]|nr:hypothetical protein BC940DRAFT_73756 [Gongronella butleri]
MRSLMGALKRAENEGRCCITMINEAYTSQVCPSCSLRSLQALPALSNVSNKMEALWPIKICVSCRRIWNRDVAAATNMVDIAQLLLQGLARPAHFVYKAEGTAHVFPAARHALQAFGNTLQHW